MFVPTEPYRRALGNGLLLKSLSDEQDAERLAVFNGIIHGEIVAATTRALIFYHPSTRPPHWLFVEDEVSRQIVSSICLIPWTWRYEDVTLKAGEMGIVGTLPDYRRRGFIRALVARFDELLRDGDYDLSHIQGIPYFYRQFGYEYAIPLEGGWRIEPHLIPDAPPGEAPPFSLRQATAHDLPTLMRLFDEAAQELSIRTVRDEAMWRYLLDHALQTDTSAETWLALDGAGRPGGYWRVAERGFGEGLIVNEVSRLSNALAPAALRQFKALAIARDKPYIRLNVPTDSSLVQTARYLGAHDLGRYAWQIRLPDVGRLLLKLAPVLERRLAASPLAGLAQRVCLNMYRQAFDLCFEGGKLAAVAALGFSDRTDIRLPPPLAAPLLLGYRSYEALAQVYSDVSVRREWQYLVDVLFPTVASFIYTIY